MKPVVGRTDKTEHKQEINTNGMTTNNRRTGLWHIIPSRRLQFGLRHDGIQVRLQDRRQAAKCALMCAKCALNDQHKARKQRAARALMCANVRDCALMCARMCGAVRANVR